MKRFVSFRAAAIVASLVIAPAAMAQQAAPAASASATSATAKDQAVATTQQAPQFTAADAKAVLNARLAALKTVIELTPEQEKLWPPVEAAIRDAVKGAAERREARREGKPPAHFLDVLGMIANAEEARGQALRKFVDAAKPFVASLTDAQKHRIPAFLGMTDGPTQQPSGQIWIFEEEEH